MEVVKDIRVFVPPCGMNLDKDERLLEPNEHREIWNSIINVSEGSNIGCLENIKGTTDVFALSVNSGFTLPTGDLTCIGVAEDTGENAVIYFLCDRSDSNNHSIMRLFVSDYRCEWILKGIPILNFKEDYKINSANRIGDLLYWTDGYEGTPFVDYNPPRKINVVKACGYTNPYSATRTYRKGEYAGYNGKTYRLVSNNPVTNILPINTTYWAVANVGVYASITEQILDRIKYPPLRSAGQPYGMSVSYYDDQDYSVNNLHGDLFQFRYRYMYDDNEFSVWGDISDLALPMQSENFVGGYFDSKLDNTINIWVWTSSPEVVRIDIAVRSGNIGVWKLIKRIFKYNTDGSRIYNDDIFILYAFHNDVVGEVLDQTETERLYDDVPQITSSEELIEKNRFVEANYIKGYDSVDLDVTLQYYFEQIPININIISGAFPYIQTVKSTVLDSDGNLVGYVWVDQFVYGIANDFRNNSVFHLSMLDESGEERDIYTYIPGNETITEFVDRLVILINNLPDCTQSTWTPTTNPGYGVASFGAAKTSSTIIRIQCRVNLEPTQNPPPYPNQTTLPFSFENIESVRVRTFKTGCWLFWGLVYSDRAGRHGGLNLSDSTKLYIPYATDSPGQNFQNSEVTNYPFIIWEVNHRPPLWADYYQWYYAGSSISWYLDFIVPSDEILRVTPIGGAPNYVTVLFNQQIADAKDKMKNYVLTEYVWQKGDRIRFSYLHSVINYYFSENLDFEIRGITYPDGDDAYQKDTSTSPDFIVDENGNKIHLDSKVVLVIEDFNRDLYFPNNPTQSVLVEIYRPRKIESESMIYYAMGDKMLILNPHTENCVHGRGFGGVNWLPSPHDQSISPPNGALGYFQSGDCYFKLRYNGEEQFPVEALEFSDFYKSDYYSKGKPFIFDREIRRIKYASYFTWSGSYITNTNINDLSKFISSDFLYLNDKNGEIQSVLEIGYTLKVLQQYKSTSIYIGRSGLKQATVGGEDVVAITKDLFGSVVPSEEVYGLSHPSSVCKQSRFLYFYDAYNGAIIRDAPNGMFPISDYGIKDFIRDKSKIFIAHGLDNVSVYSAYNETFNLVFFSFLDSADAAQNFTIAFHEPTNKWISFYDFQPEFYGCLGSLMTSWKSEKLWLHNSGTRMNFYGTQYTQRVKVMANKDPLKVKAFKTIVLDSNKIWDAGTNGDIVILQNGSLLLGASSKLPESWFELREGKYYSNFGRNMLSNGVTPQEIDLIDGDELRGSSMGITLRNASTDETKLFGVIVESTYSPKSG